jgi:caa(3)-type oxidase subunit IV
MTTQTLHQDSQPHYGIVFLILALFTVMEIGVAYISGLPDAAKVAVLIFLAAVKVGLVLLWFMHLKFDNRAYTLPFALGLVLIVPLILIVAITVPEGNNASASSSSGSASASSSGQQTITASETSYSIAMSADSIPAGKVTFHVENKAANLPHQFTIVKTDLAPGNLPLANGTVDESNLDVVGKTDTIQAGSSSDLTVDLSAGKYVLFCNLPGHYQEGMYTGFTVTGGSSGSSSSMQASATPTPPASPTPTEAGQPTERPTASQPTVTVTPAPTESATPPPSTSAQTASIVLNSYWIDPAPASIQAGRVTFQIKNRASGRPHQITIVQTDSPANRLPTNANGDVDLSQLTVVSQTDDIPPHQTTDLAVDLSAGHYALISDIPGDYYQGMYADLNVQEK